MHGETIRPSPSPFALSPVALSPVALSPFALSFCALLLSPPPSQPLFRMPHRSTLEAALSPQPAITCNHYSLSRAESAAI
mmetsp:Transcript_28089/g.56626  ORF Transcript_28089/g.56626 Transcript_28089/m.56626 type:complete len:80 (-) Transcript_28089:358-597(-)